MLFFVCAFFSFVLYLILTAGSGNIGLWAPEEIALAFIFAVPTGLIASRMLSALGFKGGTAFLSPRRWLLFFIYIIVSFIPALVKANLDVAMRVITGKINPGIVKISPKLKTDFGMTMLANSITLTPGTLSVSIDDKKKELYIHGISLSGKDAPISEICGNFPEWAGRVAE
ncbi:MAG: Na+/H+ antiporter subunit E [Candidatus Diapherotrites archaeon]|nr:Na+/H+ antiporter subunit E [Candidatus Diapherotrites archaeon]